MTARTHADRQAQAASGPVLIPEPQLLEMLPGMLRLPARGTIAELSNPREDDACFLAAQLSDSLTAATGLRWNVSRGGRWQAQICLSIDGSLPDHGYELDVAQGSGAQTPVVLRAHDMAALRDGVQTMRQLISQYGSVIPCLHIEDAPAYAMRSYSLDVTRGRVPTMAWLKSWVDRLCLYKYNQLQLYVEHSMMVDSLSESWRGTSPLTSADFVELDSYCSKRGIELVPSISTFGHHYMTLRTRGFRDLGEFPEQAERPYSFIERQEHHTINVNHPDAFALSRKLIDSYLDLVSSPHFNIGGDETFDLGKGRSRDGAGEQDPAHMYADYVQRLCQYVQSQGHEAMLWGDIAVEMPEILSLLPQDVIVLNWLYAPDITEDKVRLVADSGVRQYVCAAVHCWNSLLPHLDRAWRNISRLARYGLTYHAEGFMVTDWGDYGHVNDPRMSIPAMIYGSQESWKPGAISVEDLDSRISILEYGDASGRFVEDMKLACSGVAFGWDDAIHLLELDDGRGGVNRDVLQAVNAEGTTLRLDDEGTASLSEVRRAYLLSRMDAIGGADAADRRLDEARMALVRDAPHSSPTRAMIIQPWLVAIEGQLLFNACGRMLATDGNMIGRHDPAASALGADPGMPGAEELAEGLEMWFENYAAVWRDVSRESELRRIADVVWALADWMRSAQGRES